MAGSGRSPGGGNGNPLQYSCLHNSMDRGAWWAIIHGVAKSRIGSQLEVGHMGIVHLTRRSKDSSVSIYKAVQSTGTHPRTASTGQPFLPTVSVRQELCLQPTARLLEVLWQSSQHPPKFQTGQVSMGPHHVPSQKVCYALIPLPSPPWVPSPSDHPRL